MKRERLVKFLLALLLLCLGVVIGVVFRHVYDMPLLETLNLVDMATLVTTIFLAVYIPEVLDRKLQVKRDKKEHIQKRIDELQAFYRRINILVQQETVSAKDRLIITNTLDICKHRLETVITLLYVSKLNTDFFAADLKRIRELCREYAELLLNAEEFTHEVKHREEHQYNQIDKETSLLIFKIEDAE